MSDRRTHPREVSPSHNGRREDCRREKLLQGITNACFKRPVPAESIAQTVAEVEAELLGMGRAEVPSQLIGERVMAALRDLDEVAYVRFASVYREFRGVDNMVEEIEGLRQWTTSSPAEASRTKTEVWMPIEFVLVYVEPFSPVVSVLLLVVECCLLALGLADLRRRHR